MNLIEGDKELFSTLLDLFKKDWPQLIGKLNRAIDAGDVKSVEQVAHRIKGNLRNFYAEEAAKIALEIEVAGRENNMADIKSKVEKLEKASKQIQQDLDDFLETL